MRTRFDQFGKQMVRKALASRGSVETDAEVPADTRRIDLCFVPASTHEPTRDELGVLGRMTAGASTFEFFHRTPSAEDLTACVIKHGDFRHVLAQRDLFSSIPVQWVISSGGRRAASTGSGSDRWPAGHPASMKAHRYSGRGSWS